MSQLYLPDWNKEVVKHNYCHTFQEADVEMKELQKEIKESTISSGW